MLDSLMKRFPAVELSYETHHKKVHHDDKYDVVLAIPYGKKAFLWCTFWEEGDVCFLLELNRDRRVVKADIFSRNVPHPWAFGTVLYGVLLDSGVFLAEDILQCRGIMLHKQPFGEKLVFFREMMSTWNPPTIRLPWMADTEETAAYVSSPYVVHHLQHRSMTTILPYVNVEKVAASATAASAIAAATATIAHQEFACDFCKPQYKKMTVFEVEADVQFDIYRLFCKGRRFYGLAYIPNFKTSVFMNQFFRHIRENGNLDLQEESEDENEFQNVCPLRFVKLDRRIHFECKFHPKFKRWIPLRIAHNPSAVASLDKL